MSVGCQLKMKTLKVTLYVHLRRLVTNASIRDGVFTAVRSVFPKFVTNFNADISRLRA